MTERVLIIDKGVMKYDGSLDGIRERFAPYREVQIELAEDIPKEAFESYGEVESAEGRAVRLLVQREQLTETVTRLMAEFRLLDLTVTDPPVEEVIGRVFKEEIIA